MKLDHEYVRNIMLTLESMDGYPEAGRILEKIKDKYSSEQFIYTFKKLNEAGFIKYVDKSTFDDFIAERCEITWMGHEFLDNIRSPQVWEEAKKSVLQKVESVSIQIISQVAATIIKSTMGL